MKGTVYSGIVVAPDHPDADLHGLIRVCIRERSWEAVERKLERAFDPLAAPWNSRLWGQTKSNAEILATEGRYGELLACPLVLAYLDPKHYKPVKSKSKPAGAGVHTGLPPKEL